MAEKLNTTEQRRRNMAAIRSKGTKLEERVSKALWAKGLRVRKNVSHLYGKPDIAIKKYKVVVFIDSCFWHVCEIHSNKPMNNAEFWEKKLKRNVERDEEVTQYYKSQGWNILRVWEHDLKKDIFDITINKIYEFILMARESIET